MQVLQTLLVVQTQGSVREVAFRQITLELWVEHYLRQLQTDT